MARETRFPHSFAFRLDNASAAELAAVADAQGVTLGALARQLVLSAIGRQMAVPELVRHVHNADMIRAALGQLGSCGNLLNQIARALNGKRDPDAAKALSAMQHEFTKAMRDVRLALAGRADP